MVQTETMETPHNHVEKCSQLTAVYKRYIRDNLDVLRKQCTDYKRCLDELYSQENILLLLEGKDIELRHVCGLVIPSEETSKYDCSSGERKAIKYALQTHLHNQLRDSEEEEWKTLKTCLENKDGTDNDQSELDKVCSEENRTEICRDRRIHNTVQHFFKDKLEYLQCTCDSLPEAKSNLPLMIGGGVGGFVLLIVVLILVCLAVRHKKTKRKNKNRRDDPWRVSYQPRQSYDGNASLYSEISDNTPLNRLRHTQKGDRPPPALPLRYAKDPTNSIGEPVADYTEPWDRNDPLVFPSDKSSMPPDYLEPQKAPGMSQSVSNPLLYKDAEGSDEGLISTPTEEASGKCQRASYFESLRARREKNENDGGYETLGSSEVIARPAISTDSVSTAATHLHPPELSPQSNSPKDYFILEPPDALK